LASSVVQEANVDIKLTPVILQTDKTLSSSFGNVTTIFESLEVE